MSNELITINETTALEVFSTENGLDAILKRIKDEVSTTIHDPYDVEGRKEIKRLAKKVSSSKVRLDNIGKELVSDWKSKAKIVDASRRRVRDDLDALRDATLAPLKEWEAEQEALKSKREAEALQKEIDETLYDLALVQDKAIEDERKAIELQKQQEKAAYEARIQQEARQKAEEFAKRKILEERKKAEEAARAAELKAKQDAERAEKSKQDAILKAQREAEAIKNAEIAKIKKAQADKEAKEHAEKEAAAKRARDKNHLRECGMEAINNLIEGGVDSEQARLVMRLIAQNKISRVTLNL